MLLWARPSSVGGESSAIPRISPPHESLLSLHQFSQYFCYGWAPEADDSLTYPQSMTGGWGFPLLEVEVRGPTADVLILLKRGNC